MSAFRPALDGVLDVLSRKGHRASRFDVRDG